MVLRLSALGKTGFDVERMRRVDIETGHTGPVSLGHETAASRCNSSSIQVGQQRALARLDWPGGKYIEGIRQSITTRQQPGEDAGASSVPLSDDRGVFMSVNREFLAPSWRSWTAPGVERKLSDTISGN